MFDFVYAPSKYMHCQKFHDEKAKQRTLLQHKPKPLMDQYAIIQPVK